MKRQPISFTSAFQQTLRWLDPVYPGRRLGLVVLVVGLIYGLSGLPEARIGLYVGVPLLVYYALWLYNALHFVDVQITATVGESRTWPVHRKVYPLYKF